MRDSAIHLDMGGVNMIQSFVEGIFFFAVYSMVGWVCETVCCSIGAGKFVNRGFLRGPYCPIYGVGAVIIVLTAYPLREYPILVFLMSFLFTSMLEYVTSWLMEALFQMRWWDYSHRKLQLNGRVSLLTSLLFGGMGMAMVYFLHPALLGVLQAIPPTPLRILGNAVVVLFLLDFFATVNRLTGFTQGLQQVQAEIQELKEKNAQFSWYDKKDMTGSLQKLRGIYEEELSDSPQQAEVLARIDSVLEKSIQRDRTIRSYPHFGSGRYADAVGTAKELSVQQEKSPFWKETLASAKSVGKKTVGAGKTAAKSVAAQLDFHHLFWVFVIASVIGYVVETLFCLLTRGYIESRQGMLYGPFNQIYGFGAVLMVLFLTQLTEKNDRWLFVGSAVLGGGFEVLCSVIQEKVFGSTSWDYSGDRFALAGGRTSLQFMLFWGILGLWFMKSIHPKITKLINRIPRRQGITFTSVMAVLMCVNMALSATAVTRWVARVQGIEPSGSYSEFLDRQYPDERMEEIYPNLDMSGIEP